jgi:hypothetical protein
VSAIASGLDHCLALVGGSQDTAQASAASPAWNGSRFSVVVPARKGRVYRLEYKDSMSSSTWIGLPLAVGTGETLTLVDPTATTAERYYRVRRW